MMVVNNHLNKALFPAILGGIGGAPLDFHEETNDLEKRASLLFFPGSGEKIHHEATTMYTRVN